MSLRFRSHRTALGLAVFALVPSAAAAQFMSPADVLAAGVPEPDFEIAYGEDPSQFGHLRLPDGDGPFPVVVVVHGGCWISIADLTIMSRFAADLTDAGVATWNVEYRRVDSPGGGWPATFLDLGAGVDHLRTLATEHPLDLDRVVVTGHSSGGHLALWVAARPRIPQGSPLHVPDPLPMRGVVSLAGPGQLEMTREIDNRVCGGDVIDALVDGAPDEVPANYAAASPLQLLPLGVPQRILTGDGDRAVPPRFGNAYAEAARAAGDDAIAVTLAAAGHFEPIAPGSGVWAEVRAAILGLLP